MPLGEGPGYVLSQELVLRLSSAHLCLSLSSLDIPGSQETQALGEATQGSRPSGAHDQQSPPRAALAEWSHNRAWTPPFPPLPSSSPAPRSDRALWVTWPKPVRLRAASGRNSSRPEP